MKSGGFSPRFVVFCGRGEWTVVLSNRVCQRASIDDSQPGAWVVTLHADIEAVVARGDVPQTRLACGLLSLARVQLWMQQSKAGALGLGDQGKDAIQLGRDETGATKARLPPAIRRGVQKVPGERIGVQRHIGQVAALH